MVGSTQDEKTYAWIDSTPEAVVITDQAGRILALNEPFERLLAIPRSRLPAEPVEDLIIPSRFRPAYRAARRMALAQGRYPVGGGVSTLAAVSEAGGEFAVNLSVARTSQDPLQLATWIRDLTDDRTFVVRTLRREVLHQREEELAGLGSWDWMPESKRMVWSDNLFRIYGLRPGEITPSIDYTVAHCHPDDREPVRRSTVALARTGRCPQLRYRYVWPDGTMRHLVSTVVSVARSGGRTRRLIGAVQDVTEQQQAEREIAAHFAVSDALSHWEPGKNGARSLLRDLAEAFEFELGVMLVPRGDALATWVVWQAQAIFTPERELALSELRLARNEGLAGSAWASGAPARVADVTDTAAAAVRTIDAKTGLRGALAVPATNDHEVLAVFTFASRQRQPELQDRFMRSLAGIGYEIGGFLARRRGELRAPALTPRELEVLQLSATGYPRRQIAEEIDVSEATVKTHLGHIYKKLGVAGRASAVGEGLRQGLIR